VGTAKNLCDRKTYADRDTKTVHGISGEFNPHLGHGWEDKDKKAGKQKSKKIPEKKKRRVGLNIRGG